MLPTPTDTSKSYVARFPNKPVRRRYSTIQMS